MTDETATDQAALGTRAAKNELHDAFAQVGKALANGHRIELLDLLAQGERSVEVLATRADISVALASAHLQALRRAGLVASRRDGNRVLYRLADDDVYALLASLRTVASRLGDDRARGRAVPGRRAGGREPGGARRPASAPATPSSSTCARPTSSRPATSRARCRSRCPELEARLAELPADVEIVAYCRGPYCAMSPQAVALLERAGRRARRLEDGYPEWRLAGLPVVTAGRPRERASTSTTTRAPRSTRAWPPSCGRCSTGRTPTRRRSTRAAARPAPSSTGPAPRSRTCSALLPTRSSSRAAAARRTTPRCWVRGSRAPRAPTTSSRRPSSTRRSSSPPGSSSGSGRGSPSSRSTAPDGSTPTTCAGRSRRARSSSRSCTPTTRSARSSRSPRSRAITRERGVLLHTDAAQSVGKIPTRVDELGVDLLSIAGHKAYAPKGVGALYIRRGVHLEPLVHGAGHESGRRAGTESALLDAALGEACAHRRATSRRWAASAHAARPSVGGPALAVRRRRWCSTATRLDGCRTR